MSRSLGAAVENPTAKADGLRELPYVALENVESKRGRLLPGSELPLEARDDAILCGPGDVLFGKLRPYLVKCVIPAAESCCSSELLVLRPRSAEELSTRFLYYISLSQPFVEWAVATSDGVKMPRTDWASLRQLRLELPSRDVQDQVTRKLDSMSVHLDELVAECSGQLALLEERHRTVVKALLTGKEEAGAKRHVGPWWSAPTPVSWVPHKLGRVFRTGSGTTPSTGESAFYGGPHYWLNTAECRDGTVESTAKTLTDRALREHSALKTYPSGSLVVAMYGATIGRLAVLKAPMTVNQACCVLYEATSLDTMFAFWWLWAHRPELLHAGVGGGQSNINQEMIKRIRIPAPHLDEQRVLVEKAVVLQGETGRLRAEVERQLRLIDEHRQVVITDAVTNTLGVTQ